MTVLDIVNRVFREFKRYTGDGLPGEPANAPLPEGDPSSGVHHPKKSEMREALLGTLEAATENLEEAVAASATAAAASAVAADASRIAAEAAASTVLGLDATSIQGRLSLVSAVTISDSDVSGATTIFYVPSSGKYAPIFDGTSFVSRSIGAQISLALDPTSGHTGYHQAAKAFDLFAIVDGSAIKLVTGPAWSSGTDRGVGAGTTDLEVFNGIRVNKNTITARFGAGSGDTVSVPARHATYVGSFYASANGQATDTRRQRLLYNTYNKGLRPLRARDVANNWSYNTSSWRQVNGNAANQIEIFAGLNGDSVSVTGINVLNASASGISALSGIGLDTASPAADSMAGFGASQGTASYSIISTFNGPVGLGLHALKWLEFGGGTGTQTWLGTNNDTQVLRNGLNGTMLG